MPSRIDDFIREQMSHEAMVGYSLETYQHNCAAQCNSKIFVRKADGKWAFVDALAHCK